MPKTILQAIRDKLSASGATVADGLGGKGLTVSEAIDALELEGGGVTPSGTLTITENTPGSAGRYAVDYAKAVVRVRACKIEYDPNGGTGFIPPTVTTAGWNTNYSDGTGLTPPPGKRLKCWGWGAAVDPSITVPLPTTDQSYVMTAQDETFYAIWEDDL